MRRSAGRFSPGNGFRPDGVSARHAVAAIPFPLRRTSMNTSIRVLGIALALLLLATRASADEAEDHAARYVKRYHANINYSPGKPVTFVRLQGNNTTETEEILKNLAAFRHLQYLEPFGIYLTDEGRRMWSSLSMWLSLMWHGGGR